MTTLTVSCDPGKDHCGLGLHVGDRLFDATVIRVKRMPDVAGAEYRQGRLKVNESRLPYDVARAAERWFQTRQLPPISRVEFVGEQMLVVPPNPAIKRKKKVDPEDLLFCQSTMSAVCFAARPDAVRFVYPEEHKGTIPAEDYWERVIKECSRDAQEKMVMDRLLGGKPVCDKTGHGVDAVGIGQWAVWRRR